MPNKPTDLHNRLARGFVIEVAAQTDNQAQMMVVLESVIFASLLILTERDGMTPQAATVMMDECAQEAGRRLAEHRSGKK